jgi:type II secretory pathway component PulF
MVGIVLPEVDRLLDETGSIKTWVLVVSTSLVVCTLVLYGIILVAVPSFGELFAGFGSSLPILTALVIGYSKFTVVLALIGVLPLISMWRVRSSGSRDTARDFRRIIAGFGIALFVFSITVTAMYLPVFKMGEVVS